MEPHKAGIGRVTAAIVAIAAMLPYLTLKIVWLSGNPVGITDPAMMNDPTMTALNGATFGMAAVGAVLALAFTMRWGMRLPAWLVLLPIWVGTGLLSLIVLSVPVSLIIEGAGVFPPGGPIEQWVYLTVYAGFIGQGVGLTAAFALYARDRWPHLFTKERYGTAFRPFHTVIAWGVAVFAVPIGAINLYWAFGGTAGLARELVEAHSVSGGIQMGVKGVLAWAGAAGFALMVRGRAREAMVAAWLGGGTMFAWGFYSTVITVLKPPLTAGVTFSTAVPDLLEVLSMLTGLAVALAGAFLLVERSDGRSVVQSTENAFKGEQREHDRQPADRRHH